MIFTHDPSILGFPKLDSETSIGTPPTGSPNGSRRSFPWWVRPWNEGWARQPARRDGTMERLFWDELIRLAV